MHAVQGAVWLNEPDRWSLGDTALEVTTNGRTDFWRETFYGFTRDSGHALLVPTSGPFTAEIHVEGGFEALYDQAGLMLRLDERNWVKAGVEYTDGALHFSTVVTRERSDWSITAYEGRAMAFRLRLTYRAGAVRVQASQDGRTWSMLRLAAFPESPLASVGPMCCTPERAGLQVTFTEFRLGPPIETDLHDLT